MSYYTWILDAGHGGITPEGVYTTAPGKMHTFEDGMVIHEGVTNRKIAGKLIQLMKASDYSYDVVNDEVVDTPLGERVRRADLIYGKNKNCIYLSIHSDAMPDGSHGKASGLSIYTSRGQTKSDKVADIIAMSYAKLLAGFKLRKDQVDGDADMEADFYVLRKTDCPAVLVENLFFDNRREAEFLSSEEGQEKIAIALFDAMASCEMLRPV